MGWDGPTPRCLKGAVSAVNTSIATGLGDSWPSSRAVDSTFVSCSRNARSRSATQRNWIEVGDGKADVTSDGSFRRAESPRAEPVGDRLRELGFEEAGDVYRRSDEHQVEMSVAWVADS